MTNKLVEVRYAGNRCRVFRIYPCGRSAADELLFDVCTSYKNGGMEISRYIKQYGFAARNNLCADGVGERWTRNITQQEVRRRLERWRKTADKAGLTSVDKWKIDGTGFVDLNTKEAGNDHTG